MNNLYKTELRSWVYIIINTKKTNKSNYKVSILQSKQ